MWMRLTIVVATQLVLLSSCALGSIDEGSDLPPNGASGDDVSAEPDPSTNDGSAKDGTPSGGAEDGPSPDGGTGDDHSPDDDSSGDDSNQGLTPALATVGYGCADRFGTNNCVYARGTGFEPTAAIELRDPRDATLPLGGEERVVYGPDRLSRISDGNRVTLSLRLSRRDALAYLESEGLILCVVNPNGRFACGPAPTPPFMNHFGDCESIRGLGINYESYDIGNYEHWVYHEPCEPHLHEENRHPLIHFDLAPQNLIDNQLLNLRARGIGKIATTVYFGRLGWNDSWQNPSVVNGVFRGFVQINPPGSCFAPPSMDQRPAREPYETCLRPRLQVFLDNIRQFSELLIHHGFDEVVIRFQPVGSESDPSHWSEWRQQRFWENYLFMRMIRAEFERHLGQSSSMLRLYDLGKEMGGTVSGQSREYMGTLWWNYTRDHDFGAEDRWYGYSAAVSYGFHLPPTSPELPLLARQRIRELYSVYETYGHLFPDLYAVDVYVGEDVSLGAVRATLDELGESTKPIIVQETFLGDPTAEAAVRSASLAGALICYAMPWPLTRGYSEWGHNHAHSHCAPGDAEHVHMGSTSELFGPAGFFDTR